MWKLPVGYSVFGQSNDGKQLTAVSESSTAGKPRLIMVDRVGATYNQKTGRFSVPEYRLRVMVGTVDSDGLPKPERLLSDVTFRTPVGSDLDQADWYADVLACLSDASFFEAGVQDHFFPEPQLSE